MSRIHRGDCLASQGVNFLETTVTLKTRLSVRQASRYSWTSTLISELFVCFLGLKLSDPDRHALIVPASGNAPKNLLIASWMRRQSFRQTDQRVARYSRVQPPSAKMVTGCEGAAGACA